MLELSCKVKGNASPQGKPRVYFTCHPSDFEKCSEKLSQDIFQAQDCAIYYTANMAESISQEDRELQLRRMNLFVIPVSLKLLIDPNRAMDEDFAFAVKEHIPILPIAIETGLDAIYSREDRFGDRNYLFPDGGMDNSGLTYQDKLRKYLQAVLIDDKTAERVRAAFDCYVFLSYRKKDRKYADELMRLIHKNPACRDIAIWYDEYLTPGEGFNDAIAKMLNKSQLYTLLVTPNLINEENYVHTTEYPAARKAGKTIFPAEMEATDRAELELQYEGIPACATAEDGDDFHKDLLNALQDLALRENDNDIVHTYLIGLAYLEGIDVEVDRERALDLITSAAEAGLIEAMQKLYSMYCEGKSVPLDYQKALEWAKKIEICTKREKGENHPDTLNALCCLADVYVILGDYKKALTLFDEVYTLRCNISGENHAETIKSLMALAYIYDKLGKYQKALELDEKALVLCCRKYGDEHLLFTLPSLNDVASAFYEHNDYVKAMQLVAKEYELYCKASGKEGQIAISKLNNPENNSGDIEKRKEELKRIYLIFGKQSGEEHPYTLIALNNLAATYKKLGNQQKALELLKKSHVLHEMALGEDHPVALKVSDNLAELYGEMGDYFTAITFKRVAYTKLCKTKGREHPDTLDTLFSLANTYSKMGELLKALELHNEVYTQRCKVLGVAHPDTLTSISCIYRLTCKLYGNDHLDALMALDNLANAYVQLGNYTKAMELQEELYALRCKVLGDEHTDALTTLYDLVQTCCKLEKHAKVLELQEKVLSLCCKLTGNESPEALSTLGKLSIIFGLEGDRKKAQIIREKLFLLRSKESALNQADQVSAYSGSDKEQEEYKNLDEFEKVYRIRSKLFGDKHPKTIDAKVNLAITLDMLGKAERALQLCDEILQANIIIPATSAKKVSTLYKQHEHPEKARLVLTRISD